MRFTEKLTYANVVSTLCLFLLLIGVGGTAAYAHGMIGSGDIINNSIKSKDLKNNNVKSKDIKNNNVKSKDLKDNNVKSKDIKDDTLQSQDVRNETLQSDDIQDGTLTSGDVKNNTLTGGDVKNGTLTGGDLAARTTGVALAGGSVGFGYELKGWFNRLGGAITVANTSAGEYDVTVPGASFDDGWQEVVMSITSTGNGGYCYLSNAIGDTLEVRCRNFAGSLENHYFKFVLFQEEQPLILIPFPRRSADEAR